jgi:hypothetical protein
MPIDAEHAEDFHGKWHASYYPWGGGDYEIVIPHWIVVFAFALLGAAMWIPWRFSLRMLLIVTTLIAGLLGLIIWLIR